MTHYNSKSLIGWLKMNDILELKNINSSVLEEMGWEFDDIDFEETKESFYIDLTYPTKNHAELSLCVDVDGSEPIELCKGLESFGGESGLKELLKKNEN